MKDSSELQMKLGQQIVDQILEIIPDFWDNPNGPYENKCPFCGKIKYTKGLRMVGMQEIEHEKDCTYLLAMKFEKNDDEKI